MKFKHLLIIGLVIAALAGLIWQNSFVDAATSNPSTASPGYQIVSILVPTTGASLTGLPLFKAPWPCRVMNVMTISHTMSGATYTLMVKTGGTTSLLSSAISGTTLSWTEGTLITSPNIADEAAVTADLTVSGFVSGAIIEIVLKRQ